nr:uncharacterized protein LOC123290106 isoform X5 [Equus asinus]
MGVARVSSLPLEAVLGTAGWRRAGVIPTAGAGRRSQRWLRGAPAQAKEGQEPRIAKLTPSSFGLEKRVSEGPGIGGKGPEGATSLHPGRWEAGGSRSADAGVYVPAWGHHLPTSSRYHPGFRGGGRGQGTAEPSPERDANRQSWEKSLRARELSMLPPRAAPACTQLGEGATGRRRWPPEGVWDRTRCT